MKHLSHPQTIFCLMGPTASGKTRLAIELVKSLPFEIISVDSAMVYRDMNIGTAKPTPEENALAPHHLINICDASEPYSAGQFRGDVLEKIRTVFANGRIPLLVGGTMMYFHVLQNGLAALPDADPAIRNSIYARAAEYGWEFMHGQLQQVDPLTAAKIHPNDSQRISRALEIYHLTGKSLANIQQTETSTNLSFNVINIAVAPADRNILHDRIAKRFQQMLQQGFLSEVEKLFQRGDLNADLPSMRTVGYRQFWDYLNGEISYERACERAVIATRQLAKRQLTWLRSWENLHWFASEGDNLVERVTQFLEMNCRVDL